jgi:cytochrome c-type biogenesis protein CcmH/NrfG
MKANGGTRMNRSRVVPFCLLVLLIPPLTSSAQSKNPFATGTAAQLPPSSAVTSVRELQIPQKARKACESGARRFAAKDVAGSVPEFQKAIKAFPGYYEAYVKLGAAELDLEHWGDAEAAFRKAIELSGGHYALANFGLGLILATVTKEFTEAETVVRTGLATAPADVTGHFVLAWVLYSTARLQEAEESAREAVSSNPNLAGARLLLAQIHFQERNFSAAVEDIDAYLSMGVSGSEEERVRGIRAEALRALPRAKADSEIAEASR